MRSSSIRGFDGLRGKSRASLIVMAAGVGLAVTSCSGSDSGGTPDEALGSARLAIAQVPADVQCARIVAQAHAW